MDPLSGFSLAASVLQVVDFSFKAVGMFRGIYKHGSLAEHTDMTEIADELGMQSPTISPTSRLAFSHRFCQSRKAYTE